MHELTYVEVKLFMETNCLKFKPGQDKISYPIIVRIHKRLQEGHRFSNIKVLNDVINDGHHRFISLCLLKMEINYTPAGENTSRQKSFDWKDVELDTCDYDTDEAKKDYCVKYDKEFIHNGL